MLCNIKCINKLNACPHGPIYLVAYLINVLDSLCKDPSRDPVCVLHLAAYHSYYGMTVVCVLIST